MIVYGVFIIKSDGTPLLTEYFQSKEDLPDSAMLGRFFIAIKGFADSILKNEISTIEVEGLAYHVRNFGFFNVIIVTDLSENPDNVLQDVGFRFMKQFSEEMLNAETRLDKFYSFRKTLEEIIEFYSFDKSQSIKPTKFLNTRDIYDLPLDLQPVALTMLSLGEGTIKEIANESNIKIKDLKLRLEQLQHLGYLGKKEKKKEKEAIFFCLTY